MVEWVSVSIKVENLKVSEVYVKAVYDQIIGLGRTLNEKRI